MKRFKFYNAAGEPILDEGGADCCAENSREAVRWLFSSWGDNAPPEDAIVSRSCVSSREHFSVGPFDLIVEDVEGDRLPYGGAAAMTRGATEARLRAGFYLIPEHMREAISLYVLDGVPVDGFLQAVLSNDFMQAFAKADSENTYSMHGWARFLYNHVPSACFGSPESYENWKGIQ